MSSNLKLKSNAGGSVSLIVDDTLITDETFNVSEGGIENGSNANGDYTKFPDGTIIMKIQVSYASINVADGAIFKSATATSPLPIIDLTSIGAASMRSDVVGIWGSCAAPTAGEIQTIMHRGISSTSPRTGVWTIHGRWK